MSFDTFTVTRFDPKTGKGYARQTASAKRSPLHQEPIGFSIKVGEGLTEYFDDGNGSYGIRIPSREIAQRVPEIGTSIRGGIALEFGDSTTALDEHGFPFLRNWFYQDQYDEVCSHVLSGIVRVLSDDEFDTTDETPEDDDAYGETPEDRESDDTDAAAEIDHGRRLEMYDS